MLSTAEARPAGLRGAHLYFLAEDTTGPVVAGVGAERSLLHPAADDASVILRSPAPRSAHLSSLTEQHTAIDRPQYVKSQLESLADGHPEVCVPAEILSSAVLEDLTDAAVASGRARASQGNRVSTCVLSPPDDQYTWPLVFSCCGQIGEQLVVSLLTSDIQEAQDSNSSVPQVTACAQLSLGSEILQLNSRLLPAHTLNTSTHNGLLAPHSDKTGANASASASALVVARSDTRVDVLVVTVDMISGHARDSTRRRPMLRVEWRGSLHSPSPIHHCTPHPLLPELAVVTQRDGLGVVSLAACLATPAHMTAAPLPLRFCQLLGDSQTVAFVAEAGMDRHTACPEAMRCCWGVHPRSLLLAVHHTLWRCDTRTCPDGRPQGQLTLLHTLMTREPFLALARCDRPVQTPAPPGSAVAGQAPSAHTGTAAQEVFSPYVVALTATQVVLVDTRRPQSVVLEAPHCCTGLAQPFSLSLIPLPHTLTQPHTDTAEQQQQGTQGDTGAHRSSLGPARGTPGSLETDLRFTQASQALQLGSQDGLLPQQGAGGGGPGGGGWGGCVQSAVAVWGCAAGCVHCLEVSMQRSTLQLMLGDWGTSGIQGAERQDEDPSQAEAQGSLQLFVIHTQPTQPAGASQQAFMQSQQGGQGGGMDVRGDGVGVVGGWRPACTDRVWGRGLVRRLCAAHSASQRVEQQGARSAPGPRASGDWVCDVRYMGARQGHRGTAQLEWTVERETRARGMPDIQGMSVMPLWSCSMAPLPDPPPLSPDQYATVQRQHTQTPSLLLVRATFTGDVLATPLCVSGHVGGGGVAVLQGSQITDMTPARGSQRQAADTTAAGTDLTRQLQDKGGKQQDDAVTQLGLLTRFMNANHAGRMLLGDQVVRTKIQVVLDHHNRHMTRVLDACGYNSSATAPHQQQPPQPQLHDWCIAEPHQEHGKAYGAANRCVLATVHPSILDDVQHPQSSSQQATDSYVRVLLQRMACPLSVGDLLMRAHAMAGGGHSKQGRASGSKRQRGGGGGGHTHTAADSYTEPYNPALTTPGHKGERAFNRVLTATAPRATQVMQAHARQAQHTQTTTRATWDGQIDRTDDLVSSVGELRHTLDVSGVEDSRGVGGSAAASRPVRLAAAGLLLHARGGQATLSCSPHVHTMLRAFATVVARAEQCEPRTVRVALVGTGREPAEPVGLDAPEPAAGAGPTRGRGPPLMPQAKDYCEVVELGSEALQRYMTLVDAWPVEAKKTNDCLFVGGLKHLETLLKARQAEGDE